MNTLCRGCHISSLLLAITFLLSIRQLCRAADTLNIDQTFRDNGTTLISSGGRFELGFYSPAGSRNRYVGIWYKRIAVPTVVWTANAGTPVIDGSGELKVFEPGVLALLSGAGSVIWSTNTSRNLQIRPVAKLLDSGNLVMKDSNDNYDNPENFLWQSFDYPTDTLLPGMKLGVNFITGLEVQITSQKSAGDPAPGNYTCRCDPTGTSPQIVIRRGTDVVFRTGPWNGIGFSGYLDLQQNRIFMAGVVMNENEMYYRYDPLNKAMITRFVLNENGVGQMWVWADQTREWTSYLATREDDCDAYNSCGAYGYCNVKNSPVCGCLNKFNPKDPHYWDTRNWSEGCTRSTPLNCQRGDSFSNYSGIKLPDTQHSWISSSVRLEECEKLCSKNCSCMAYASLYIDGTGCVLWFGDLVDIRDVYPGQDIYIRMASSELDYPADSGRKKREILILALSLVIGTPLLCLSLFLYIRKWKKLDCQRRRTDQRGGPRCNNVDDFPDKNHEKLELPMIDFSRITKATDNFSITNKLGQGGFGPVYKGVLEEGQEIAVKCLSRTSRQGVDEFKNEVVCIEKLQHRNLVKLLGWCVRAEEMMLVYEYMANGSLDLMLFDPTRSILLDWPMRFNIIFGIARGLLYLHQDSRLRVIHRDLKTSNILLDSDMNPKISDFGLARMFGGNETGSDTGRIVGTYGYISPEYAKDGLFSVKSDVFSYGVIILEIVSGKRNKGFTHGDHHLSLLGHAWALHKEERSLELVDSYLEKSCYLSEVMRCIHIGLLCVQECPEDRPGMCSVVLMLGNQSALPQVNIPDFFKTTDVPQTQTWVAPASASSLNAITTSLFEAR